MIVILDSGHNTKTAGKRSEDGKVIEAKYCHRLGKCVYDRLFGIEGVSVFHLDNDLGRNGATDNEELNYRIKMANAIASVAKSNKQDVCLVSIHLDAGAATARGASVFTAPNASKKSELLASEFANNIWLHKLEGNRACVIKEGNFGIISKTSCPAVLVECAFMTNIEDEKMLLSQEGFNNIVDMVTASIKSYIGC